ncbi:V-type ATP synthase subunit E [Enterococcus sp.]|uniref:V-type ATP synthase subunit E n=1 Tax=Enterococcus sp. TaxID=35783 RepID=UPI002FC75B9A
MSDITKLTTKIKVDAVKKQAALVKEAEKELTQSELLKKTQLEKESAEHLKRYERELQRELSLKVSELHVKSRNRVLAAKQQILDELFEEAKVRLQQLPADQVEAFVLRKLQVTQLTGEVELIFGDKTQPLITEEMMQNWQNTLGDDVTLKRVKHQIPNRSGVVFRQGEIEFNYIFEALLESKEEDLSYQLIELIFEQE